MGATESVLTPREQRYKGNEFLASYELDIDSKLGEGSFGSVYPCTSKANRKSYAVKCVDKAKVDPQELTKEADLMSFLKHPNIVTFHEAIYTTPAVFIIMVIYSGGDLVSGIETAVEGTGSTKPHEIKNIAAQLMAAICYLHAQRVVHRDVKGDNYLMDRRNIRDPECRIALCDFGSALLLNSVDDRLQERVGTKEFLAPESFAMDYGVKVDVWAVGVTLYTILCAAFPFRNRGDVQKHTPDLPSETPEEIKTFVLALLEKNEKIRPNAEEALMHDYIVDAVPQTVSPSKPKRKVVTFSLPAATDARPKLRDKDAAAVDRRVELLERMHASESSGQKSIHEQRKFWNGRFTVLGARSSKVSEFCWSNKHDAMTTIKNSASSTSMNSRQLDESDHQATTIATVKDMLTEHEISTAQFGTPPAKTIEDLVAELHHGEARLMIDATNFRKLVRVVNIVVLRVGARTTSGEQRYLVQSSVQHTDKDASEDVLRLPADKKSATENSRHAAERILREKLYLAEKHACLRFDLMETFEEQEESRSYPGLTTVYVKEIVPVDLVTQDTHLLQQWGLPRGEDWNFQDGKGNTRQYRWLTEADCHEMKLVLKAPLQEHDVISGLVVAPVCISEEQVEARLQRCRVDTSAFNESGRGSLRELTMEIQQGECSLIERPGGDAMRVVDVVLLKLSKSNEVLTQTAKLFKGKRHVVNRLPALKRRPEENQFHTVWRLIRKQLGVEENFVELDVSSVGVVDAESVSATFPGLRTLYRKRIVAAKLLDFEAAERRLPQIPSLSGRRRESCC